MLKRSLALAAGIALSLSAALAHAETLKELKVSAIPDEAPTELLRKFKPLGAYLEKQLGMPVKFVPVADYAGVVEALAADRLDMAWLGGFTFVQARLKTGNAIPLVQREQDQQFTSKFITADPQVKSLQDLKGKTFAFGSVSSTSGSLMPRYFMQKDGIVPEQFFSRVAYSGAHDATVAWVQAGKVDAGVLNASVWQKLVDSGKVDTAKVKVFATTPTYYDYNWTVRGNLDPALAEKIKQALPRPRPGETGRQGDPRPAGRQPLHRDQSGQLQGHRGVRTRRRPAEVSLSLDGVDLVHADGQRALADIRLRLAAGERVALIGPSGAGKTSLLRVLASQWRPSAGRVELLGEEPWALSAAARQRLRARIGLVHQAPPLPPRQRVVSAVLAGRLGQWPLWKSLVSLVYPLDRAGAHDALQRLDLGDKLFQRCDQLSGGQLQRVGIARVLYQRAELILADEPVSAMDPVLAGHTLALLNREAAARGSTLLASLHAVDLALQHFPG